MQKLLDTLSRIGSAELSELLGKETISILEHLDSKQVASYKLASLVVSQFGSEGLLLDKPNRQLLVETLSEDDVQRLCRLLDLGEPDDPWTAAVACRFPRGSDKAETLFSFFGCEPPQLEDEEALSQSRVCVSPQYPLFDHQIIACRKAISLLGSPDRPRVLLHMPTGAGKTRTAMNLISHFIRHHLTKDDVVIWLAHSEELCEQAAEEFEKSWAALGVRNVDLHRCFGTHDVDLAQVKSGLVVGGLQMMFSRSQGDQNAFFRLARKTKLLIMDEAHQAIAPTYQHILEIIAADPNTAILGLSATPGRSTLDAHEDLKLANFFDRKKVTLEVEGYDSPVEFLQDEGYLAKVNYERLTYAPSGEFDFSQAERAALQEGLDVPSSVLKKLGADEKRNLLVLSRILDETINANNKIIVFACSVDHAHLLANILTVKGVKAAAITSRTRTDHRRNLIRQFKDSDEIQVLTNYGVLTTGFDAPRTNVAVVARPTNSVVLFSQMIGRAARGVKAGGNQECKVVTIVDELPGFRSIAEAFEYWDEIWD
jgi:superfamily II DNA or RNA helicase